VVQEIDPRRESTLDVAEQTRAVRKAIAEQHDVNVYTVALIRAGSIPRTTSGKVQRSKCRETFLAGALALASDGGERK